jgi:hypothetical protein
LYALDISPSSRGLSLRGHSIAESRPVCITLA